MNTSPDVFLAYGLTLKRKNRIKMSATGSLVQTATERFFRPGKNRGHAYVIKLYKANKYFYNDNLLCLFPDIKSGR